MPKTKISEFSSTPANNTDIDSINIAEGCSPSGINDAIRELMSQLKDWQSGTSNDPMVIGSSGSLTLNQGTANGVTYLNGSKVVTSGSALWFDGTNFGVGTGGNTLNHQSVVYKTGANAVYQQIANGSTGLGATNGVRIGVSSAGLGEIYSSSSTPTLTFDTSGNLGLGVTPSAWSGYKVLQAGIASFAGGSSGAYLIQDNAYTDNSGAGWKYINSGYAAAQYYAAAGAHVWRTAPSGTAGNAITFTQRMTLTAGGKLFVNTTSGFIGVSNVKVDVGGRYNSGISGVGSYSFGAADGGGAFVINDTSNGSTEVERMRINSSGNVGIGQTSPAYKLDVFGTTPAIRLIANGVSNGVKLEQSSATGDVELNVIDGYALKFATSNTERARIDSSGNLLVGTTSQTLGTARLCVSSSGLTTVSTTSTSTESPYASFNTATSGNNQFMWFYTGDSGQTFRGSIEFNRTSGLVVYNTTSDYRAKDISGPVTDSGALIDSVPVYMGKMKGATQERPMFLAHETPDYAHMGEKDAIDADGNPVYQRMDASALIPVMWAEIQSLRKRLADAGL